MQNPIYVRSTKNPEKIGIVVSEHLFQTPVRNENGENRIDFISLLGVCWENARNPAIDYVYPSDLEWLAIESITNDEDDEDDDVDFDEIETVSPERQI